MIKLIKPYITYEEVEEEFKNVFSTGWFTKGKFVDIFKEELRKYTGAQYAFLTTSATTALWTCLKILEIKNGDEVIISDFSFPATVNVVEDLGAKPVFADVDINTFNMIPEELESKLTSKTKAVIFVDSFGNPSGIHKIKEICNIKNIPLIEDAACAIGSSENGVKCGNIADFTCFSFHPRKLLTTGEGGAITTNNKYYANKLGMKLNHGSVPKDGKDDFVDYGYNFRLPELQSIMGIKQLAKLDNIVTERNNIRNKFIELLTSINFQTQKIYSDIFFNVQSLVFKVPNTFDRDRLIAFLKTKNIESTIGTYCLSGTKYYLSKYKNIQPNSHFLFNNTITLPCYRGVSIKSVCDSILYFLQKSSSEI